MSDNDMIQTESYVRLLRKDGKLGCLYDPRRRRLYFVGREGKMTYDLDKIDETVKPKAAPATEQ